MTWTSIVLGLAGYAAFNYVMFLTITRKELKLSKVYFLFMFFLSGISMGLLPFIIGNNPGDEGAIVLVSNAFVFAVIVGIFIFVWNWFIKIVLQGLKDVDDKAKAVNPNKEERLI